MWTCSKPLLLATCASWAIFHIAFAGFSCLSNPCLYGICIDDLNSSYTCYCIDGYTGIQCQTNWDECWSSPCLNGGTCQDGIAAFNCTCPDGYTGDTCERNLDECDSNPCFNNGTCLDGVGGYTCICPPGYSGAYCEADVAVCNATGESRCMNGGICIEGPGDTFTCSCPPGWSGMICEVATDECASSPCVNGGICVDLHADYACACPFGYTGKNCDVKLELCTENPCENNALCLVEDGVQVCYCVPDYHGNRCQFQYDECQLGPRCMNGGTCLDGIDDFSCSCPPNLTGQYCECFITESGDLNCTYPAPLPSESPMPSAVPATSAFTTVEDFSTGFYSPLPTTEFTSTISQVPSVWTAGSTGYSDNVSTIYFTTMSSSTESSSGAITPSSETATLITALSSTEASLTTSLLPITEMPSTTFFTERITVPQTTTAISTELTEEKTAPTPFTQETSSSITLPAETEVTSNTSLQEISTFSTTTFILEQTTSQILPEGRTASSTEAYTPITSSIATMPDETRPTEVTPSQSPTTATDGEGTHTTTFTSSTTELPDCSMTPCLNGGTCIHTKEGPRCVCKFGWEGALCDERSGIRIAAFTGQSYLSHRLSNSSGTHVKITARTMAPSGILLYAHLSPEMYMYLYLEDGLLKFQFSCGIQTMLFSEVQLHVNNGFDLDIQVVLELLDLNHCTASLRINNTLAMSGEQMASIPAFKRPNSWVHLGGIPPQFLDKNEAPLINGFIGCMHGLQIDNKTQHVFRDAVDGYDISECSSLACLSNPCFGSSTCVEDKDSWHCLCPSGFSGKMCEQSVCEDNPCKYGSTCVPFPGSGFLCLCPLGKHGLYCEHDLEIGQPSFSSSVGGLSSYAAYPIPGAIHNSMELKFKFTPSTIEQIALMVFVGQDGYHDSRADHLAVSFIKGYVVLTWNLGSGPRRIFTPRPVVQRANRPHTIRLGRMGQNAWLVVDNLGNVTGKSPGRLTQLNTRSPLYLGGHESGNFSLLPHDLPQHSGFSGCIYDVELKAGRVSIPLQRMQTASGRSVGQCGTTECHERACQHGGACLHHGATFTCLCPEGWFGPLCAQRFNPCDSTRNNCSSGSTCVPLPKGYECDCPLGKAGKFCERDEPLSDVAFSGVRSYLTLPPVELHQPQTSIDLEVRPLSDRGLLLYVGARDKSFFSLSLQGGVLELRLASGKLRKRGEPIVLRSGRVLATGAWHRVLAGHYGRRLFLRVDGIVNTAAMLPGELLPSTGTPLYLGGVPDFSTLPVGSVSGLPIPFKGCVRQLSLNWQRTSLDHEQITSARNIADCDGTGCGGDVCYHGGSCWLDNQRMPHCNCHQQYTGPRCESQLSCTNYSCQNNGRCVKEESGFSAQCHCPIGWGGDFCEEVVTVGSPHFNGDSFLIVEKMRMTKREDADLRVGTDINFLYLNFSTAEMDGMILWSAKDQEYIGVGIEKGLLKLVWSWNGPQNSKALIPADFVSDGEWHDVSLHFGPFNLTLWIDRNFVHSKILSEFQHPIATDGIFYMGGFPGIKSVEDGTLGNFKDKFSGCIREFAWHEDVVITDFSSYQGENIRSCDILQL